LGEISEKNVRIDDYYSDITIVVPNVLILNTPILSSAGDDILVARIAPIILW